MRLLTSSLLLGVFVLGGIIFKLSSPNNCANILPNDSIFVLTGDARRIPFAVNQIKKHPYSDLYIIGAGTNVNPSMSIKAFIESTSKSTYQNARAIKRIATKAGLDRIVLITTEDHIHRAKYLIQSELPNTEIVACPAILSEMSAGRRLERWTIEYIKYIVTRLGIKESN